MINHSKRFIFVHIPKTAGKSIHELFGMRWQNHKDLLKYQQELEPLAFKEYFKFTIVRNPWDRIVSEYNFQKSKPADTGSKHIEGSDGKPQTFREWVLAAFENPHAYPPGRWGGDVSPAIHRWSPQADWISIDGQVAVDTILRLESLENDFLPVANRLGVNTRIPCRNWKYHHHYSTFYDAETREIVTRYYAKDIELFGYKFEECKSSFRWFVSKALRARLRYLVLDRWQRRRKPLLRASGVQ